MYGGGGGEGACAPDAPPLNPPLKKELNSTIQS